VKIADIKKPKGANKATKRLGRGNSSGYGGTSGKGHKGQLSRSGGRPYKASFEGGQMPLVRRLPKRGFRCPASKIYEVVNIGELNKFRKNQEVTKENLKIAGLIRKVDSRVKILAKGKIEKPLKVAADKFSSQAKRCIEEAGGSCTVSNNR